MAHKLLYVGIYIYMYVVHVMPLECIYVYIYVNVTIHTNTNLCIHVYIYSHEQVMPMDNVYAHMHECEQCSLYLKLCMCIHVYMWITHLSMQGVTSCYRYSSYDGNWISININTFKQSIVLHKSACDSIVLQSSRDQVPWAIVLQIFHKHRPVIAQNTADVSPRHCGVHSFSFATLA